MFSVLHIDVRTSWEIGIEEHKASCNSASELSEVSED